MPSGNTPFGTTNPLSGNSHFWRTAPATPVSPAPAWRKWGRRLLLAVGGPAFVLLAWEGVLRLAGYGYPTPFFLDGSVNGRAVWVDNWQFGWRFFPPASARMPHPLVLPRQKSAESIRIFVLGESAALGDPSPEFGFSRMLRALLRERFPGREFEVINVSMVAINSHVILPIARECARRDGDLWVIYMGNNEVIGPFGAAGLFGAQAPPQTVVRANLALKTTRVGQFLDAGVRRLSGKPQAAAPWRGMQMWTEAIGRDDPRMERVHANFRKNLEAILNTGRAAGIPIILSTVACNWKDCSPFASRHRPGLTPAQEAEWTQAYQAGVAREAEGNWAEARAHYQAAARWDERFAELQFRLGTCCLALGRTAEARQHFQRAKDEDGLQFRPDTRINQSIRQLAAAHSAHGVSLLDAEELFARNSAGGIPGEDLFYEHVHLNPAGNYLLARATAELTAGLLPGSNRVVPATNAPAWLSPAECEQRVGLTDWGRAQTLQLLEERLREAPFTAQTIHSNQMERLRTERKRLRPAARPVAVRAALQSVQAAVDRDPADAELLKILAPLLEAGGDPRGAEQRWREVTRLLPQASVPYLNLAQLLGRQGRDDEAALAFEECLRRNPANTDARGDLGLLRLRQGRLDEAILHLRVLERYQPHSATAHWLLGQALLRANRQAGAIAQFQQVLRWDPHHAEAKRLLEEMTARK